MDTKRHIEVCALLRQAERAAQEALDGNQDAARLTLGLVAEVRQRTEETPSGLCVHPDCSNELSYAGRGRPPRFCSAECRTDVYRATQIAARALLKSSAIAPTQN
ncbi:hypothetical protein ACFRMN_34110 [Streptomyces sp. NPDC056835]|uniref:hypothetical protein n=1 Tax=Streptomyces sp. NPDC056835 TaxID=3345956 RepID=UPI003681D545